MKKAIQLRLSNSKIDQPFADFDAVFEKQRAQADEFYASIHPPSLNEELKTIRETPLQGFFGASNFTI